MIPCQGPTPAIRSRNQLPLRGRSPCTATMCLDITDCTRQQPGHIFPACTCDAATPSPGFRSRLASASGPGSSARSRVGPVRPASWGAIPSLLGPGEQMRPAPPVIANKSEEQNHGYREVPTSRLHRKPETPAAMSALPPAGPTSSSPAVCTSARFHGSKPEETDLQSWGHILAGVQSGKSPIPAPWQGARLPLQCPGTAVGPTAPDHLFLCRSRSGHLAQWRHFAIAEMVLLNVLHLRAL